jgi:hypothetical protein
VLLRLLQSALPKYAQIRHGPIEEGKDIAALIDSDGIPVLHLYQVKCGDISKPKWREAREELEEMFTVDMNRFQLPVAPDRVEGHLVTNGHANLFAERVMEGWFKDQRARGRSVEFMHLDALVTWISKDGLVNELRAALKEQGISIDEDQKRRDPGAKPAKRKSRRAPRPKGTTKRAKTSRSRPKVKSKARVAKRKRTPLPKRAPRRKATTKRGKSSRS